MNIHNIYIYYIISSIYCVFTIYSLYMYIYICIYYIFTAYVHIYTYTQVYIYIHTHICRHIISIYTYVPYTIYSLYTETIENSSKVKSKCTLCSYDVLPASIPRPGKARDLFWPGHIGATHDEDGVGAWWGCSVAIISTNCQEFKYTVIYSSMLMQYTQYILVQSYIYKYSVLRAEVYLYKWGSQEIYEQSTNSL